MAKKYIVTVNGTSYEVVVEDADPNATYTKAPEPAQEAPKAAPAAAPAGSRSRSRRQWGEGHLAAAGHRPQGTGQAGRCRQERRRALHHRSDENGKRDYGPLRRNGFRRFGQRGRIGQRRRPALRHFLKNTQANEMN